MAKRKEKKIKLNTGEKIKPRGGIIKTALAWTVECAIIILIAFAVVYFWGQQRINVGPSMDPTLLNGDKVLVNSLSYKFSGPKRNDIIVFKPNGNDSTYSYVKRVIGITGDTIQIIEGVLYVNDEVYQDVVDVPLMYTAGLAAEPVYVGEGEVFVLGDSRNNSEDSRSADIGNVQMEHIEGKAWFVISNGDFRLLKEKE
jgi:signal peptidase I, bacterial type